MAKRKSLSEALSPEEEAFLENGKASEPTLKTPPRQRQTRIADPRQEEQVIILPHVPDFPDAGLTTLNVRIEPSLVGAVLRASMVRKIKKERPYAQREIVAEAVRDWLTKHGYLR